MKFLIGLYFSVWMVLIFLFMTGRLLSSGEKRGHYAWKALFSFLWPLWAVTYIWIGRHRFMRDLGMVRLVRGGLKDMGYYDEPIPVEPTQIRSEKQVCIYCEENLSVGELANDGVCFVCEKQLRPKSYKHQT